MPRFQALFLALATLSVTAAAPLMAQNAATQTTDQSGPAAPPDSSSYTQSQAAPIQRSSPAYSGNPAYGYPGYAVRPQAPRRPAEMQAKLAVGQPVTTMHNTATARPAPGVFVRVGHDSSVQAVSMDAKQIELRVDHGVVNVSVHHSEDDALILVDLPGGQLDLVKDGFYTFNAATNTARVLVGEAAAFAGSNSNGKPLKVKEDHAVVFSSAKLKSVEFGPQQEHADVVPGAFRPGPEMGFAGPGYGEGFYGEPYGYGYGYPYYAYGYPFGFGLGFGYGFYGGYGFGGGYGRFHGRW